MTMTVSVVIPAFNRPAPLRHTLRSAAAAIAELGEPAEIVLVDDGSSPPLREQLPEPPGAASISWQRQPNQGSIVARGAGLAAARGEFVLFLDSDDLIHPAKLRRHVALLRRENADVSYDDMAVAAIGADGAATYAPGEKLGWAGEIADWALRVQPAPHDPVYRRAYLRTALSAPLVPADRRMDPAGDIWLYYNLAVHPARIVKLDDALTAVGPHEDERFSRHWENLGVAALRVMRAFAASCPSAPETLAARRAAGEAAFRSWRRLPRRFHPGYDRAMLELWRRAPRGPVERLGEARFVRLAKIVGAEAAARLLRPWFNPSYAACRTLSVDEYRRLFSGDWLT